MILDEFDPKKPFYGLVLTYLSQVHGFFELASRGLFQRFEKYCRRPTLANLSKDERIARYVSDLGIKDVERVLRGGKTVLMYKPVLPSRTGEEIRWDSEKLSEIIFLEYEAMLKSFNRQSAGSLLTLADALVPSKHRGDPICQFSRHCRNAAAHNGVFTFKPKPKKPYPPARWRTLTIEQTMQGTPLFADHPKPGFIGIADVLYLLADIEKKFM